MIAHVVTKDGRTVEADLEDTIAIKAEVIIVAVMEDPLRLINVKTNHPITILTEEPVAVAAVVTDNRHTAAIRMVVILEVTGVAATTVHLIMVHLVVVIVPVAVTTTSLIEVTQLGVDNMVVVTRALRANRGGQEAVIGAVIIITVEVITAEAVVVVMDIKFGDHKI